jgi:hypothetical protein
MVICAGLVWALYAASVNSAENQRPLTDLPGITSWKDLESGLVALKPADVQFYVRTMRAAVDRYQHATAKDLADIAEAKRLRKLQMIGQTKMTEDMKAGNWQKAGEDLFKPTPEQSATLDRADALIGNVQGMLAKDAGMPVDQWDELQKTVEYAAGLDQTGFGSGDDGPQPILTAAQKARVKELVRVRAADKDLVTPSAPEIARLYTLVGQLASDRAQNNMSP